MVLLVMITLALLAIGNTNSLKTAASNELAANSSPSLLSQLLQGINLQGCTTALCKYLDTSKRAPATTTGEPVQTPILFTPLASTQAPLVTPSQPVDQAVCNAGIPYVPHQTLEGTYVTTALLDEAHNVGYFTTNQLYKVDLSDLHIIAKGYFGGPQYGPNPSTMGALSADGQFVYYDIFSEILKIRTSDLQIVATLKKPFPLTSFGDHNRQGQPAIALDPHNATKGYLADGNLGGIFEFNTITMQVTRHIALDNIKDTSERLNTDTASFPDVVYKPEEGSAGYIYFGNRLRNSGRALNLDTFTVTDGSSLFDGNDINVNAGKADKYTTVSNRTLHAYDSDTNTVYFSYVPDQDTHIRYNWQLGYLGKMVLDRPNGWSWLPWENKYSNYAEVVPITAPENNLPPINEIITGALNTKTKELFMGGGVGNTGQMYSSEAALLLKVPLTDCK